MTATVTKLRDRKARGAYSSPRSKGGPGGTGREDDPARWKPSLSPLHGGRDRLEIIAGSRGGAQLVNPRGGALETRYRKGLLTDEQFAAGAWFRNQIERATGGGKSSICKVLEACEVGEAALEKRTPARTITDCQADAMAELGWAHCRVGRTPYRVLTLFFANGMTLAEIDRRHNWPLKAQRAAAYLDGALEDLSIALLKRHKNGEDEACSVRSDSAESHHAEIGA